jgi:hypothetical protein
MPQTNQVLRDKFMKDGSDGRHEAETIIRKAGGTVEKGFITYDGDNDEAFDAIQFLIEEWDYGTK